MPERGDRMSHFTRIKTQMVEREYLMQALRDLGYRYVEGAVAIRGYNGKRTPVEIQIPTNNLGFDIGFRRDGDVYEMVADWWGIRDIDATVFQHQIVQRYAYHAAQTMLAQQGFSLVGEQEEEGRIHLRLRRVV